MGFPPELSGKGPSPQCKTEVRDLAIFGGAPAFTEALHVGRPNVGDRAAFLRRVNTILDSRWLSNNGIYVQEFERRIAQFLGVGHCIAVCNATAGLEITMHALGLTGEVVLPSFTFIAAAHAVQRVGLIPVFCDVDPITHTIAPDAVERCLTPRTSAILGVHLWGRACEVDALQRIAMDHDLKLLFDAAHAFGGSYHRRMIGGFGDAEVFSFHATKFVNTFEGGAITTNNDRLAAHIRRMANFGFAGYDTVVEWGTNAKMSEIAAAMGLTGLEQADEFIALNRLRYQQYAQGLEEIPGVRLMTYDESEHNNYQYVVLEIEARTFGVTRDQLVQVLWAENVLARRYFYPGCHRMEPYRSLFPGAGERLPHTERLTNEVLVLPAGAALYPQDVETILAILRFVAGHADGVRAQLTEQAPVGQGKR